MVMMLLFTAGFSLSRLMARNDTVAVKTGHGCNGGV